MQTRKKTLILFSILIFLITGVALRNIINYNFFTYSYNKCYNRTVDDCIKMVNKIDSDISIVDLPSLEYYQLKVFVDLPDYSQRAQIFNEQKVSDFISLPIDMDNELMRKRAGERIVDRVAIRWCERPSLLK
jgi:hypothetical protein